MPRVISRGGDKDAPKLGDWPGRAHGKPLKLSWPREGDRRRAVVATGPSHSSRMPSLIYDSHMIHVTDRDMIMHYNGEEVYRLAESAMAQSHEDIGEVLPALKKMRLQPWSPVNTSSPFLGPNQMMAHFENVAARALPTFGMDPARLGEALVRIASLDSSSASRGLTKLLQSFAVVQKYGVHEQMMNLKIEALRSLSESSRNGLSATTAIQHLAAGMMLCSIEIHRASCTTGQWLIYLCGVKKIQRYGSLPEALPGSDLALLLDWAYYVEVVARFSFRHWSDPFLEGPCPRTIIDPTTIIDPAALCAERPKTAASSLDVIELLGEVSDATSARLPVDAAREDRGKHVNFLKILGWRIQKVVISAEDAEHRPEPQQIMDLFRSALLVYLYRANQEFLGSTSETQERVDHSFEVLARLRFCDRQFPIFVFGCEARTEEQRRVILDVMARTEETVPCRSYQYMRTILAGFWSQDDLADGHVEYSQRLGRVLRWCTNLPAFV